MTACSLRRVWPPCREKLEDLFRDEMGCLWGTCTRPASGLSELGTGPADSRQQRVCLLGLGSSVWARDLSPPLHSPHGRVATPGDLERPAYVECLRAGGFCRRGLEACRLGGPEGVWELAVLGRIYRL